MGLAMSLSVFFWATDTFFLKDMSLWGINFSSHPLDALNSTLLALSSLGAIS